ncbi:MAG: bis(5'-nucleosyl)-tetraphosphatase (symmetrical) YqeK [Coriobacteriia bacterium]|nr:bis(5'-nucleosyl)-tetraphosphatase (symmetrical) YqeK [Coriobacteriia bacterium]MBS5478055.1 bis(5'-nucleosyl)-tetraphosphatase (symmetrical) YqeK [Coriobacteriia bacterium]
MGKKKKKKQGKKAAKKACETLLAGTEKSPTVAFEAPAMGPDGLPTEKGYAWAGPEPLIADAALRTYLSVLRTEVERHLTGHRLRHSLSVARTAGRLAAAHGVDPFLATAAGLLHDWDKTKQLTTDDLWAKAERYGLVEGERDPRMAPILHGWTAAASLPETWDLPAEVFQAISRHTIGATDMSDLDIVVYVADMLEPLRGDDAEYWELRRLAQGDLRALFAACARQSCLWVIESGRYLYPEAIRVWNAYEPYLPDALRRGW